MQNKLDQSFYSDPDTIKVAKSLLGKVLITDLDGFRCAGIISETEAYLGVKDKASHAYGNRRTARTEIMYAQGGVTYVYLCYGIHRLFNVITGEKEDPQAVLIRELIPIEGLDKMKLRRNKERIKELCSGPGKVSEALGIELNHNGLSLESDLLWIEDRGIVVKDDNYESDHRIGVQYAEEDALLPYRFTLKSIFSNELL